MIQFNLENVLPQEAQDDLGLFIIATEEAWRNAGLIKKNSFGVEILIATRPLGDFTNCAHLEFGATCDEAEHDQGWYIKNAHGKNLICVATGIDSLTATRLHPGITAHLDGAFPWGGAVIDELYGLIVGTSGFKEDEDGLFSMTVLCRLRILMDRIGEQHLAAARSRGSLDGKPGFNRFTSRAT